MRLFVAIEFPEEIKDSLCGAIAEIERGCRSGRFTLRENLHLTLAFIGETPGARQAAQALEQVSAAPFEIRLDGLGRFRRGGRDLWWAGVSRGIGLDGLRRDVAQRLREAGFAIEKGDFSPHITLGREVELKRGAEAFLKEYRFDGLHMTVNGISLMRSDRIAGKLTYTRVFRRAFTG